MRSSQSRVTLQHSPPTPPPPPPPSRHRGLPSELNQRWRPAGYNSDGEEEGGAHTKGVDSAALKAGLPFAPSAHFAGARPGYLFTTREAGVGYYRDPRQSIPGEGAGEVLQQMLVGCLPPPRPALPPPRPLAPPARNDGVAA